MRELIKAECLKQKNTMTMKLIIISPVVVLLLALLLTRGRYNSFAPGAWNWWYTLFLPGTLALLCNGCIQKDKKKKYHNIFGVGVSVEQTWISKMILCAGFLFASNLVICVGAVAGGICMGTYIGIVSNLLAAVILTITYLWEIPIFLFLSAKLGMVASVMTGVFFSIVGTVLAPTKLWLACISSMPVRAMCPILTVMPNGLPVEEGSRFLQYTDLIPAVGITVIAFGILTAATMRWFAKREER